MATNITDDPFPQDAFSLAQRQQGAVILHIIGIVFMAIAIALVSAKFFVPALEVMAKKVIFTYPTIICLYLYIFLGKY